MTNQNNAAHDLRTSKGGRAYIAEYFATQLGRHDFTRYISDTLAADFACALAQHLSKLRAPVADERAVMIPLELANRINDALGRFVSDEGWGQADMDTADDLGAFLSALASAPVAEPYDSEKRCRAYYDSDLRPFAADGLTYNVWQAVWHAAQFDRAMTPDSSKPRPHSAPVADEPIKQALKLVGELRKSAFQRGVCPDSGACHHGCVTQCARQHELGCVPLGASGLGDDWKLDIERQASAPVAGEAHPVAWLQTVEGADPLVFLRTNGWTPPNVEGSSHQWRPLVYGNAAPQASEADDLIGALGQCRDAFPVPASAGSPLDFLWQEAMSNPAAVPVYVKACAAQGQASEAVRNCTCHPDDRPAGDCQKQYAASECQTQADKDGGDCAKGAGDEHERLAFEAWAATEVPAHKLGRAPWPYEDQYNWVSMDYAWSMWRKIRAALSAQPAKEPANPNPSATGNAGAAGVSSDPLTGKNNDGGAVYG